MIRETPIIILSMLLSLPYLAVPGDAPASPLDALVERALDFNHALRAQRKAIKAEEQVPIQAGALPDPMADVEFMNLSVDRFDAGNALTKGVSVGLTQRLPYPGKRALRTEAAEREVDVERARLRAMESRLRGGVHEAAYRYVLAERLLEINGETAEALRAAAEGAAGVYASGSGTQADLLLAQTALTKNQADRVDLERRRAIALDRLEWLVGGPVGDETLKDLDLPEPRPLPSLDGLFDRLEDSGLAVAIARGEEAAKEAAADVAERDFKPDFTAGVRYRHNDMSMGGGDFVSVMFGMTLPFFHRKDRYEPALREAVSKRESAGYALEEALASSRFDLSEAFEEAERERRVFDLYQGGLLIQAEEAYRSSLSAYTVGRLDLDALLAALTNLYGYRAEALSARAGFLAAVARLEAVLGAPLTGPAASAEKSGTSSPNRGES